MRPGAWIGRSQRCCGSVLLGTGPVAMGGLRPAAPPGSLVDAEREVGLRSDLSTSVLLDCPAGGTSTMPRLRVGVLGLSHDHVWSNLQSLAAGDLGQFAAVADPDPSLRERATRAHGGVETHATFDALLERRDLDAVLVF